MNGTQLMRMFSENILCNANHRGDYRGASYSFRGNVFYHNDKATNRIEKTIDGDFINLAIENEAAGVFDMRKVPTKHTNTSTFGGRTSSWLTYEYLTILRLPHIGVFSGYDGDLVTGEALHQMVLNSINASLRTRLRTAEKGPITLFLHNQWGNYLYDNFVTEVYQTSNAWMMYRNWFCPQMPLIPEGVATTIVKIVDRRLKVYNDPKAVEQRERKQAVREAKKALGLEKAA